MRKIITCLVLALVVSISFTASADCRGCCSRHKGVVCVEGKTQCKDGSPLSDKCRLKGCSKCEGEVVPQDQENVQEPPQGAYNRKDWPHWTDADNDCQNTRSEILQRDNIGTIKWKRNKPCNVSWGEWKCPYTGKTFTKASDVDIDHIVPLAHAHRTGGTTWTRKQKRAFANDPLNLLAVEDNINQEKGAQGPTEWKPPRKEFWAEYAKRWWAVKVKYNLTIRLTEACVVNKMANGMATDENLELCFVGPPPGSAE